MAAETLSDIEAALSQTFAADLYRQWNRSAVLASMIMVKPGAGKNAAWDVEFSGNQADTVAEGSDVGAGEFNSDINEPAILQWAHYRSSFQVSETQLDAAATSIGTAGALVDLFGDRILGAGAKIAEKINIDLYAGTGVDGMSNPTIVGIHGGALETTGLYAGLDRSTRAEWTGNVLGNGAVLRALTHDLLYQLEEQIFTACGEPPNVIVCSPGIYRKYAGLFEEVRRLATDGMGPLSYRAGAATLFWQSMPVIRDRNATVNRLSMLNTNYIETKFLPRLGAPRDAVMQQMKDLVGSTGGEQHAELTMTQIPARCAILAKTGDSVKMSVKTTLATCVKRPNASGYITDISET